MGEVAPGVAERWVLEHLYWIVALLGVVRLVQGAFTELAPDEAVYWMWSRHLAGGYLDHPPMIALINWLSRQLLGDREIAVRLPAVLLAMGTLLIIVKTARLVLADSLAVAIVAAVWVCSPMLAGFGLIFTPDTPAMLFSAGALWFALVVARRMDEGSGRSGDIRAWLGFGVCCGLGLDSKYPVVLLPMAAGASLLCSRKGWRELGRPGPWVAGTVALGLFSPVIWWNATHRWASFLFQLRHGTGEGNAAPAAGHLSRLAMGIGNFLGGQALLWTPILLGISAVVLWKYWRAFIRLNEVDRMLLLAGSTPLAVFGLAAMKAGRGEINWPAFAYVPISILIGRWAAEKPVARLGWARLGWQVALGFTVVLEVISAPVVLSPLLAAGMPLPHSVSDLIGWDAWGRALAKSAEGLPIVCNRHQDAAEATFYVPGRPDVWCDSIGTRPAAYDYFDDKPDFARIDRLLYVGGNRELFMARYGYTHSTPRLIDFAGDKTRTRAASILWR